MRTHRAIVISILACLLVAGGAYFWATGLIDSVYAYRSPLRTSPPAPSAALGEPLTGRLVIVLIDALREDTSRNAEVMPFLNVLRGQGASALMHSRPPSYSEPGYSVLFTGAWPDLSDGPAVNLDYANIPAWTQDNLFSAAARAGLQTGVSGYNWFEKLIPQQAVSVSFYTPGEDQTADREVVDAALPWLEAGAVQLVLIHIDQVDYAGHHEGGPRDPRWDAAAQRADGLLREIAAALDFSQDTLLVVSDHGQIDRGGHGGHEAVTLLEPWVLVGKGVIPGAYADVQMVDVAPTAATLLGVNLPAASQGQARAEMLALSAEQSAKLEQAWRAQQDTLAQAYATAIGADGQTGLEAARQARLTGERWPRALLALAVAALAGWGLWRLIEPKEWPWLALGALIYLAVFNLRYAVLDGLTYSLSSVTGATDLILYCAATAGLAWLAGWLVVAFGLKLLRHGPGAAAGKTLGLALLIMGLLALPVLVSFALNGVLVTWTLPDFPSMFLAFLSLLQILIVAVFALLSVAIAGMIARTTKG